jgi:hypothetical protein
MSIIIYLFEFQPPMCSPSPKFLNFYKEIAVGTIPVAEIISGKIEIFSKHQRFLIIIIKSLLTWKHCEMHLF